MKRVHCVNLGCRENLLTGSLVTHYFARNGWEVVEKPEDADVIVLNSCGFSEDAERMSMREYGRLMAIKRTDARLLFAGCLPAINGELIRSVGYRDALITPRTLGALDDLIEAVVPIESLNVGCLPFTPSNVGAKGAVLRAVRATASALRRIPCFPIPRWLWQMIYLPWDGTEYVRVGMGCRGKCSYCAIRRAIGTTRSVPIDVVLERFEAALRNGRTCIALSCDELGSYGQDIGTDIATLLERMVGMPGDFHLILRNVEPEWIRDYWERLEPVFRSRKIAYVVTPLQSGSDRILKLMNRSYTVGDYRRIVEGIRRVAPRVLIRSHVIVGFPGETEDDFRQTCRLVSDLPLDFVHVFGYSKRPSTPAAAFPDQVPRSVIDRRRRRMMALNLRCYLKKYRWVPLRP